MAKSTLQNTPLICKDLNSAMYFSYRKIVIYMNNGINAMNNNEKTKYETKRITSSKTKHYPRVFCVLLLQITPLALVGNIIKAKIVM